MLTTMDPATTAPIVIPAWAGAEKGHAHDGEEEQEAQAVVLGGCQVEAACRRDVDQGRSQDRPRVAFPEENGKGQEQSCAHLEVDRVDEASRQEHAGLYQSEEEVSGGPRTSSAATAMATSGGCQRPRLPSASDHPSHSRLRPITAGARVNPPPLFSRISRNLR